MELKLEFLKRILIDTISNEKIRNDFFEKNIFPEDEEIKILIKSDIVNERMEGLDWPERAHTMIGMK